MNNIKNKTKAISESKKIGLYKEEVQLLDVAQNLTPTQQVAVHIWLLNI